MLLAVPKSVFAALCNPGQINAYVVNSADCCYTIELQQLYGAAVPTDDAQYFIITVGNPAGLKITGAGGPETGPAATFNSTSATYFTDFSVPNCDNTNILVTLCINGQSQPGGATIQVQGYSSSGSPMPYPAVNVTLSGQCYNTPPCVQFTCPNNVTNACNSDSGGTASFTMPTATSTCFCAPGPVTVQASWPTTSGGVRTSSASTVTDFFPMGTTPVTITAWDSCFNSNTCTFTVTITNQGNVADAWWEMADGAASNGTNSQIARGIAVDNQGNVIVVGIFTNEATFKGLPGVGGVSPITMTTSFGSDAFVVKYNSAGGLLWAVQGGAGGQAGALAVAVDSQGNALVGGFFDSNIYFNYLLDVCADFVTAYGPQDMFLAKLDPYGNTYWVVSGGDEEQDTNITSCTGVAMDSYGNCYATGGYSQDVAFNEGQIVGACPAPATVGGTLNGSGFQDAYLVKYDPWGNFMWATNSQCPSSVSGAIGRDVTVQQVGGKNVAWVTGSFSGTGVKFAGQPGGGMSDGSSGFDNAFVAAITNIEYPAPTFPAPTTLWAVQMTSDCGSGISGNSACGLQDARSIGADTNGNCYFTAYFNGSAKLGSLPAVQDVNPVMTPPYGYTQNQLNDYLIGSIDLSGNPRWLNNGGQLLDNESRGLAVSPSGIVFLTGELGADGQLYSGGQNILFNAYDSNGGQILSETGTEPYLEPSESSSGYGVTVDAGGCFYITGAFDDPGQPTDVGLQFPNFTLFPPTPLGAQFAMDHIFVAKYCPVCTTKTLGCIAAPANLVLWLPFDESGGTLSENLGSPANPGTQVNGPSVVTGAYVDNSLNFTGTQYVTVPDYPGIDFNGGDFTIDAWVSRAVGAPNAPPCVIVQKQLTSSPNVGYCLSLASGQLNLTLTSSSASITLTDTAHTILADGTWHFVAVSVSQSAGLVNFYVDGATPTTMTLSTTYNLNNNNQLRVGAQEVAGYGPWYGDLDEVEIFNRALSGAELQGIFGAGTAGKCKPASYLTEVVMRALSPTSASLTWPGGQATVEAAPELTGPWSVLGTNVASPFNVPVGSSQQFFRIKNP